MAGHSLFPGARKAGGANDHPDRAPRVHAAATCPGNPSDVFAAQLTPLPTPDPECNVEDDGQPGARTGEIRRTAPSR
jgi:hypothetical protein